MQQKQLPNKIHMSECWERGVTSSRVAILKYSVYFALKVCFALKTCKIELMKKGGTNKKHTETEPECQTTNAVLLTRW